MEIGHLYIDNKQIARSSGTNYEKSSKNRFILADRLESFICILYLILLFHLIGDGCVTLKTIVEITLTSLKKLVPDVTASVPNPSSVVQITKVFPDAGNAIMMTIAETGQTNQIVPITLVPRANSNVIRDIVSRKISNVTGNGIVSI